MSLYTKRIIFYSLFTLILGVVFVCSLAYYQLRNLGEIKTLAIAKLEELTRREVKIGETEMDIVHGLSIRLRDVSIKSRFSKEPELRAQSVFVVVRLLPLLARRIEVKKIIVQGTTLRVVRDAKGRFSLGNVKKWINEPAKSGLFKILRVSFINQLMVDNGSIHFQDYLNRPDNNPVTIDLKHINFYVQKKLIGSPFLFNLNGKIIGESPPTNFNVSGAFDNFSKDRGFADISIDGKVRVDELNISNFQPYLKKVLGEAPIDTLLSIRSNFSGNIGGALTTQGTLKYSFNSNNGRATLSDASFPLRGDLEYKISLDQGSLYIEELKSDSGPFKYTAKVSIENFLSKEPSIFLDLVSDSFQVNKSIDYLPLKFFPEKYHTLVKSRLKNGSIKIKSLKFSGNLGQLMNLAQEDNYGLISSEFEMKHMDWQFPLPELKNVTGAFSIKQGNTSLHIASAQYENQPIYNVHGTITDIMTRPLVDLKLENKIEMNQFHEALKRIFKGHPLFGSISIYNKFEGKANVLLDVKGPLGDFDKLAIFGKIGLLDVSLNEEGFEPRLKNLNGEIIYTHTPEAGQRKDAYWVPVIQYDNLSGNFSKSSFSNMNGEMGISNGEPLKKMSSIYKIASSDLFYVMSDNKEDALVNLKEDLDITSGELIIKYKSQGNPTQPETEKEWGEIQLKNFSMKYRDRYQPLINLNGNISYGDGNIRLENLSGRYGDSPVELKGDIVHNNIKALEYALRIKFPGLLQSDLKDITLFEDLKFSGPAHISLNLNGNLDFFKFEYQADLAQVGYQIPGVIEKQPNALSKIKAKGSVLKNGGMTIDKWSYELGENLVSGTAQIPDLDNPEFTISIAASNFQVYPSRQFFKFFDEEIDGNVDFKIVGSGNLIDIPSSKFEGDMKLKELIIRPKNFLSFMRVDANLKFKENRLDIRSGKIKSDKSGFNFSGVFKSGESPNLDLYLVGKKIVIDEFFPEPENQEISLVERLNQYEFFKKGKGRVKFNLDQMNYKFLSVDQVAGSLILKDKKVELKDLTLASNVSVKSGGTMFVDSSGVGHFEGSVKVQNMETNNLFGFFGDVFGESLSGKVKNINIRMKGIGKDWKEISKSLFGKVKLDIESGNINQDRLKRGVRRLFSSIPQSAPLEEDEFSPFREISGDFISEGGIFKTENFVYETTSRRTSIVGNFDLVNDQIDAVVGVAPMAQLDRFLTKIPLVGKIITGGDEKSFLKTYYTVKGDFNEPKISAIPLTSLGKKVIGIFQGILQTPKDILAPITDNLPDQKLSPSAVSGSN